MEKPTTKQKMIDGAIRLLATKGLQATSFNEVLALTGAPRGSIYHHFPEGKDQLVATALAVTSQRTMASLTGREYDSPVELTEYFIGLWRSLLTYSDFTAGCSVLAVAIATDSDTLRQQANAIFTQWEAVLTQLFTNFGIETTAAQEFSAELISATEGAVVIARAAHAMQPFDRVASRLVREAELLYN